MRILLTLLVIVLLSSTTIAFTCPNPAANAQYVNNLVSGVNSMGSLLSSGTLALIMSLICRGTTIPPPGGGSGNACQDYCDAKAQSLGVPTSTFVGTCLKGNNAAFRPANGTDTLSMQAVLECLQSSNGGSCHCLTLKEAQFFAKYQDPPTDQCQLMCYIYTDYNEPNLKGSLNTYSVLSSCEFIPPSQNIIPHQDYAEVNACGGGFTGIYDKCTCSYSCPYACSLQGATPGNLGNTFTCDGLIPSHLGMFSNPLEYQRNDLGIQWCQTNGIFSNGPYCWCHMG